VDYATFGKNMPMLISLPSQFNHSIKSTLFPPLLIHHDNHHSVFPPAIYRPTTNSPHLLQLNNHLTFLSLDEISESDDNVLSTKVIISFGTHNKMPLCNSVPKFTSLKRKLRV